MAHNNACFAINKETSVRAMMMLRKVALTDLVQCANQITWLCQYKNLILHDLWYESVSFVM